MRLLAGFVALLVVGQSISFADEKGDKAKESLRKKVLKQLGKTDGHFLLALEETKGAKIEGITFDVVKGPEAAAERVAEWTQGGGKQTKRTFQFVARLEPSDAGKTLANNHKKKLQQFIDTRMKDAIFSRDPCYSDLSPSSGKSLNQKMAEGIAVRYLPPR